VVAVLTDLRVQQLRPPLKLDLSSTSDVQVLETVVYATQFLQKEAKALGHDVLGLGVTIAGAVNDFGQVLFAPDLGTPDSTSWAGMDLENRLEGLTGLRVVVENDANAVAVREYLRSPDPSDLAVILMSSGGRGIGAGFIINGSLVHGGEDGFSGELGHISVDPNYTERCRCGKRHGCLEQLASEQSMLDAIVRGGRARPRSIADVVSSANAGDQLARRVLSEAGERVGGVVATAVTLLNPTRVVLFAPGPLVEDAAAGEWNAFRKAIDKGLGKVPFGKLKGFETRTLEISTEPTSAAAVVVKHFLRRPGRWTSSLLSSNQERAL